MSNPVIAKALGSNKLSKVFAYQDFRAQIHDYQIQHQVSGLTWRECTFKAQTVRSPELHNQLIAVPGDKETLISAKRTILEFWRQTTFDLQFWLAEPDPQPITTAQVEQLAQEAEWVEIDATRLELYLSLCWGDPKECHYRWAYPDSKCIRIIAAANEPSALKV